jgi:tetratricopeptide (TPR) repeat protein/class 3 adenylate cyclase
VPTTPNDHLPEPPNDPTQLPLEMAYVLFMDIVAYSRLATDTQQQIVNRLQRVVRETPEFQRAVARNQLIGLPTGDGMALVFFGDPQSPVQCAVEVSLALKNLPKLPVRIGMHAGPVYRTMDITGKENVAGDGINMAQRVMDCGDAGHILVSKSLADVLRQLSGWTGALTDLGEVAVKHGVRVNVFNLQIKGVGNPALPQKFQKTPEPKPAARRPKIRVLLVAALLLLVASAVLAFVFRSVLYPRMYRKPTVAVLGFSNMRQTPDTDWASTELTEMVSTELEAGNAIRTVPGETVAQAKREMALPEGVTYGQDTLDRLHKRLKCDYILYGSMEDLGAGMGGRVHLDVHFQDVSTGDMIATMAESDSEAKLSGLASRIGASLRSKLNVPAVTAADSKRVDAAVPSTQDASKAYFDGLRQLRSFDLLAARDSFQKSIDADGAFPLSHAYLAEVWSKLGYDDRSKAEAKTAFDLSKNLLREYQIVVEARYRESVSEWDKAVDLYRTLWNFSQDDPEYALRAADVQVRAGKATDALATLAELRKKAPDSADDPRVDLREAEAYESLGDPRKEAASAKTAADKARNNGARLLEAEAEWRVCGSLKDVGNFAEAAAACNRSIELAKATGDRLLVARALTDLGHTLEAQGDPAQALQLHQQALQIARELGSQRDIAGALGNIGDILSMQGDHSAAEKSHTDALHVASEINDRAAALQLQNDIAGEKESLGDFTAALDYYQKSLDTARAIGDQAGEADVLANVAELQSLRGDLPAALQNVQRALQLSEQLGLQNKSAIIRPILGDIYLAQGDLGAAEKTCRDALQLAQKLGDKSAIAGAQLALSNLAIEKEDWTGAAQLAQSAAAQFHAENNRDMEASALLAQASAAIGQKNYPDAQSALLQAESLKSSDPTTQLPAALVSARILACTGKLLAAQKQASEAQFRAKQMGLLALQFRATLVIGEFALCGAPRPQARSLLHSLQVAAAAKGYHLLEKQAQNALSQLE